MAKRNNFLLFYSSITLLLIVLDQLIKWWMVKFHPSLVLANKGIIFGWIENPFIGYSLLVVGLLVLIWLILKFRFSHFAFRLSLGLISAGAISNLIDRIFRGYVVDYIHFFNLNVFNLADVLIIMGIFVYFLQIFLSNKKRA